MNRNLFVLYFAASSVFVACAFGGPAEPPDRVWVVGHRGFKAVAPENTIASFDAAAAVGTDYMELDVRATKDRQLILMHDGKADRTTSGRGAVADMTFEQIRALDAGQGQQVPTLREALLWAKKKGLRIDIDHKEGLVEDIAAVIRETGMIQGVVIEGPRPNLLRFADLLPGVDTMPKVASLEDIAVACGALRTTVIRLSLEQLAQPQAVAAVRRCGARVSVTILGKDDDEEGIRRVITLGTQLIETDHPDLVARIRLEAAAAAGRARRVVAIAHRGEHLHHPENTIPAFQEAIRAGADFIEVDVQTSADGKLVLSHDASVSRCTNGQGKVSEMTFEQLESLDAGIKAGPEFAGTKIPTFDQALDLARKGNIGIYVDVKNATAQDLVNHIEGHGMAGRVVIYGGLALAKQIQALNPKLKVMPEARNADNARRLVEELHPKVIAFDAGDFATDVIAVAQRAGAEIYVDRLGALDTPEGWQSAIDAGADGIQTNKPGELVEYLRHKGYK